MTRREEQQKRYQKKIKDLRSQKQSRKEEGGGKDNKNVLNLSLIHI